MIKYVQQANTSDEVSRKVERIIAGGRTDYQEYLIFQSAVHGVCISIDGDIQSCESDEGIYHEALVHPAMLAHPAPERVLIMGGGEGATAREVLRHDCVRQLVMVDIDREFVALCRRHLPKWSQGAFDDPRIEVRYQDIRLYLQECMDRFDVVIGDLVDLRHPDSSAASLYTRDFYAELKRHLNQGAIVVTQGGALVTEDLENHNQIRKTLASNFRYIDSYGTVVPSFYHLWGFVVASDNPLPYRHEQGFFTARSKERGIFLPALGETALDASCSLPRIIQHKLR